MARLSIPALQAYCRAAEVVVTFKRGTDIFNVTAEELRCFYMSDRSAPLDARIVFKTEKGVAYIEEEELVPLAGEGLFREQQVLKGGALSPNVYKTWGQIAEEVDKHVPADAFSGELSLRQLLEGYAVLPAATLDNAASLVQDGESLGAALVRLKFIKLEDLLRGAIGSGRYFRPRNHGANDVGRQLCSKSKLSPARLKEAISRQVKDKAPLGQILADMKFVKKEDLARVETPAIVLPDYDQPGEFLVRTGKITRSELLHYTLRATKRGSTLLEELVEEQKISREDADHAQRVHDTKARLRLEGRFRLGEILIEQGAITEEQLLDRLHYQVDHAAPLGALLVAAKLITPEQLILALQIQDEKLNEATRREARKPRKAAPVQVAEAPVVEDKPKRRIPVGEILLVIGVAVAMGGLALYTGSQMNKITARPDPWESEPIDPLYAAFAGEQADGAFFTAEDLEGKKKTEVQRAAELDPQYAEQVSRLGNSLQKQNTELEAILDGESELVPTPEPTATPEPASPIALPGGAPPASAPEQTPAPAAMAIVPPDPSRPDPSLILETPEPPAPPPPAPAGLASAGPAATQAFPPGQAGSAAGQAGGARGRAAAGKPTAQAPAGPGERQVATTAPAVAAAPSAPGQQIAVPGRPPRERSAQSPAAPAGAEVLRRVAVAARSAGQTPAPGPSPRSAPAVTRKPLPPDKALNLQALAQLANGSPQAARQSLLKAVDIDQRNPVLLFNLGVADFKLGQYAQASISFNKARQLYEYTVNDLELKTKPYFDMEQLPASERPFKLMKALIRANTLLADTVTYQGRAREGLGESIDAKRYYREAARLYRRNAELYDRMGDLYRRRQDLRNAIAQYAMAAKADPRFPEPWKALSLIAVEQKKEDLANRYMAIYRRLSGG